MLAFIAQRIGKAVVVLLAIVVLNFFLIRMAPGDPAQVMAGEAGASDKIFVAQLREKFGLDKPLPVQLYTYVKGIVTFDLGFSFRQQAPVAKLIAERCTGLTILTNSALTCLEMSHGQNTIIGIGGEYDSVTLSFVGSQAEEMAKSYFVDQAFLTTKGLLPADGTYESAFANFRLKQIIAEQAVETVLLVDHTKFGHRALSKVLDISQIHQIVTDEGTPRSHLTALRRNGVNVHVARPSKLESPQHAPHAN